MAQMSSVIFSERIAKWSCSALTLLLCVAALFVAPLTATAQKANLASPQAETRGPESSTSTVSLEKAAAMRHAPVAVEFSAVAPDDDWRRTFQTSSVLSMEKGEGIRLASNLEAANPRSSDEDALSTIDGRTVFVASHVRGTEASHNIPTILYGAGVVFQSGERFFLKTKGHVVGENPDRIDVYTAKKTALRTLRVWRVKLNDLALIELDPDDVRDCQARGELKLATVGSVEDFSRGSELFIQGNPGGVSNITLRCSVSAIKTVEAICREADIEFAPAERTGRLIEIVGNIPAGFSGGGLFLPDGRIVGTIDFVLCGRDQIPIPIGYATLIEDDLAVCSSIVNGAGR